MTLQTAPAMPFSKAAKPCPALPENAYFNGCARLTETQVLAIALSGLSGVKYSGITTASRANRQFQLSYEGTRFRDQYGLDLDRGLVTDGSILCGVRDRGTGRRMFANRAAVGMALGLEGMRIRAGELMGAYVWARAGAYPEPDTLMELGLELYLRARIVSPWLDPADRAQLSRLCELEEPQSLWAISEMNAPVPNAPALFDEALHGTTDFYSWDEYARLGFFQGELSLGKFMLCGLSYPARFDFSDSWQMDVLEEYCRTPIRALAASVTPPTQCATRSSTPAFQTALLP